MSKKSLPWFKCFQDAWLDGTRTLKPAERGLYWDCLCLIYKYDAPLRDDDKWISFQLHVSLPTWRAVRKVLVGTGKLIETPDGLVNNRALDECAARAESRVGKETSASERERQRRENPEFPFENNKRRPQLRIVDGRSNTTDVPSRARASDSDPEEDKKIEELRAHKPITEHIRQALILKIGHIAADALERDYYKSGLAERADTIDDAYLGWLKKRKGIDLYGLVGRGGRRRERGTFDIGSLAKDALGDLCGKDKFGNPITELPKRKRL